MSPIGPDSKFSPNLVIQFQTTPSAYEQYHYSWYNLYDEDFATISTTGRFTYLKSVKELDYLRYTIRRPGPTPLHYDEASPCASHPESTAVCVFRPCSHSACAACLGMAMISNSLCAVCGHWISRFVGFDKPVAKVSTACGNDEEGWAVAEGVVGTQAADESNDTVITLFLDEDRVSGLHGTTQDRSPSGCMYLDAL